MARIKMVDFPALKLEKPEVVKHSLTRTEQETTISFNKEEKMAYVYTCEVKWQKQIENKLGIKPYFDNGFGGRGYKVPKDRIRLPQAKRSLSKEHKEALALNRNTRLSRETVDTVVKTDKEK